MAHVEYGIAALLPNVPQFGEMHHIFMGKAPQFLISALYKTAHFQGVWHTEG